MMRHHMLLPKLMLALLLPCLAAPAASRADEGLLKLLEQVATNPQFIRGLSSSEFTDQQLWPPAPPALAADLESNDPLHPHGVRHRPAPPPLRLAKLEPHVSCAPLQREVMAILGAEREAWSITVADGNGRLFADVNGMVSRIPASNQKLVSTAMALDRLGLDHRLRTSLWQLPDGTLRLEGEGDPDFGIQQVVRMAAGLSRETDLGRNGTAVRMEFEELSPSNWWPSDWHSADRVWQYAAPITRLPLDANSEGDHAVYDPPKRLAQIWQQELQHQGYRFEWEEVPADSPNPAGSRLVHQEWSRPLKSLLTRANTDSHNNTAEVLMRVGSGDWRLAHARQATFAWLREQGLPVEGVEIADGSGLSRANRATSRFYTSLMLAMEHHVHGPAWYQTLAVANRTGTLEASFGSPALAGKFVAKTGTIRGVKALSGRLATTSGYRYFSLLANGAASPREQMARLLEAVVKHSSCPVVL